MDKSLFIEGMDEMASVFGSKITKEKAEHFFERLQQIPNNRWQKVVERVVMEDHRFPSLARLASCHWTISAEDKGSSKKKEKCAICDGYGFVTIGLEVYAGACAHGANMTKIRVAPINQGEIQDLLDKQKNVWNATYGPGKWEEAAQHLLAYKAKNILPQATYV